MTVARFVVRSLQEPTPSSLGYLQDARALGFTALQRIDCRDLYFVAGDLLPAHLDMLAARLLADPVTQSASWEFLTRGSGADALESIPPDVQVVEVALRPGVTDPVAEEIVRAAHEMGIPGVARAATGLRFLIQAAGMQPADLELLIRRLLANPVIQRAAIGRIEPAFPSSADASGQVDVIKGARPGCIRTAGSIPGTPRGA